MASSVHNNKRQKLTDIGDQTSSLGKIEDPSLILETVLNCDALQLGLEKNQNEPGNRSFGLASDELEDDTDDDDDDDDDDEDEDDDDDDEDDDDLDDEYEDDEDDDDDDLDDELSGTKQNGTGRKQANQSKSKSIKSTSSKKPTQPKKNKNSVKSSTRTASVATPLTSNTQNTSYNNQAEIQKQLAAAGPAGVAAAAAIATAKKRKRPHSFETNPSIRKRQQTRLIRKLRACIDEYTMRVGQQAIVLITMPGKQMHNYKVFGAQPLESVIRDCKDYIMGHLEQALLEQAPEEIKDDPDKHELPPLVIDGIPTPVEKMTQAQLRAFIPMMLKYSTGRGKPGWGKESTRPPWWPETLPWANVRSDARDDNEKQRISWTTTLRQIVTNCYRYHGRDDLLPSFDENDDAALGNEQLAIENNRQGYSTSTNTNSTASSNRPLGSRSSGRHRISNNSNLNNNNNMSNSSSMNGNLVFHHHTPEGDPGKTQDLQNVYSSVTNFETSNVMHTINNGDGTVSLIQVDPANTQILTLPDGTQVRAVRLQTLPGGGTDGSAVEDHHHQLMANVGNEHHMQHQSITLGDSTNNGDLSQAQTLTISEASLNSDGQIIVTGEDGLQSCYSMSNLVSIPASMYQQFATAGGAQTLSLVNADGSPLTGHTISIQTIQEPQQLINAPNQHQNRTQQQETITLVIGDDNNTNNNKDSNQQSMIGVDESRCSASGSQTSSTKAPHQDASSDTNLNTSSSITDENQQSLVQEATAITNIKTEQVQDKN